MRSVPAASSQLERSARVFRLGIDLRVFDLTKLLFKHFDLPVCQAQNRPNRDQAISLLPGVLSCARLHVYPRLARKDPLPLSKWKYKSLHKLEEIFLEGSLRFLL